jgi:hypothetical protein
MGSKLQRYCIVMDERALTVDRGEGRGERGEGHNALSDRSDVS